MAVPAPNQNVLRAMSMAASQFPDIGYCYYRAKRIQQLMNCGSVYTFSDVDYNFSFQHSDTNGLSYHRDIIIPHDEFYRNATQWAFHTVYELDGIVYTYEINNGCMLFRDYKKRLQALNNGRVVVRSEKKSYPMRF